MAINEYDFNQLMQAFAAKLASSYASLVPAQAEDQLKAPVQDLLTASGRKYGMRVEALTESPVEEVGRPDIGVAVNKLLTGHVELKAPGKGARPNKFTGSDKKQWEKFKSLPNLIYTDGCQWALYRTGKLEGKVLTLSGDPTVDGAGAVSALDSQQLEQLFRDFLNWNPIVPNSPKALANMLAPLCRLLREDVLSALQNPQSNLTQLAREWRNVLFPEADDLQFADAYTQTLTYALLLARFSDKKIHIDTSSAASTIERGHALLAQALRILSDEQARQEIDLGVDLLERAIDAVDAIVLLKKHGDPWLYFYEDFLAAYDPKLRKDRGVYYTPIEVVRAQTNLVAQLLQDRFSKPLAFADDDVIYLDPGVGTGSYPLYAIQHGLELVQKRFGKGAIQGRASEMAKNFYGFEILIGPYAVSHLRITQTILEAGGTLPKNGVHVFLTDTLESPHAAPPGQQLTLMYKPLTEEHLAAQEVKGNIKVLVCMGNPPYDRQVIAPDEQDREQRKGGWVRFGENEKDEGILEDFLKPVRLAGQGVHAKNLYNDYVYFWRWALWKVFEKSHEGGIVSFITASSYLRGPGFVGMREKMRRLLDELWIIDLEGDNLGARKTQNVFNIQTPVSIAIGVRYGKPNNRKAAKVHYAKIIGTREEKLSYLQNIHTFKEISWQDCYKGWSEPFLPKGEGDYYAWPLLTDLFPWQQSGIKAGRTWVISPLEDTLKKRWNFLLNREKEERVLSFKNSPTGRKIHEAATQLPPIASKLEPISELNKDCPPPKIVRYSYRSFDGQFIFADARLIDRPSPSLWFSIGEKQVFMTSLLTGVLGIGPAAMVTSCMPDLHHFRGSFGGKDVIPLYRDPQANSPNITRGALELLSNVYKRDVTPHDLFAYSYAILAAPAYVGHFSEELIIPGPRLPITKSAELFKKMAEMGHRLIWLHTHGQRYIPRGKKMGMVPQGKARCIEPVPSQLDDYPESFSFDELNKTLHVGDGKFGPISREVWELSVSGLEIVKSWLSYRMLSGAGRRSSPLDEIRPEKWTSQFTEELLELLWILEATVSMYPELEKNLEEVLTSELFNAKDLPVPSPEERKPPQIKTSQLSFET